MLAKKARLETELKFHDVEVKEMADLKKARRRSETFSNCEGASWYRCRDRGSC